MCSELRNFTYTLSEKSEFLKLTFIKTTMTRFHYLMTADSTKRTDLFYRISFIMPCEILIDTGVFI